MKEFYSTQGGRHAYNTDFKNLQELALAMQELFRDCDSNFVISGCNVTESKDRLSISQGFVYIDNKIRFVQAAANLNSANLYIVAKEKPGDRIPYADNNVHSQYTEFYAEVVNSTNISSQYIPYDQATKCFPNLASIWFNNYCVTKKVGMQSIDQLTVIDEFIANKKAQFASGITVGRDINIGRNEHGLSIAIGAYRFDLNLDGTIGIFKNGVSVLNFGNEEGAIRGSVAFDTIKSNKVNVKNFSINGADVQTLFMPLGSVIMWAGPANMVPANYHLCDGSELSRAEYAALYNVIGGTFNTGPLPHDAADVEGTYTQPSPGTFRLPDLRGRFIVGQYSSDTSYNTIGKSGGKNKVSLTERELPSHSHRLKYNAEGTINAPVTYQNKIGASGIVSQLGGDTDLNFYGELTTKWHDARKAQIQINIDKNTESTGGGQSHENRPAFYTLAYIMRVK